MKLLLTLSLLGLPLLGQQAVPTSYTSIPTCRVLDTRLANGTYGGPQISPVNRTVPVLAASCGLPPNATAYSLVFTVIPAVTTTLSVSPVTPLAETPRTLSFTSGGSASATMSMLAGPTGTLNIVSTVPTNLTLDVVGYWSPESTAVVALQANLATLQAQVQRRAAWFI